MDVKANGSFTGKEMSSTESSTLSEQLSYDVITDYSGLYAMTIIQAPICLLANSFTFYVLQRENSGFDDVTKLYLKTLTVVYALCGFGQALLMLLQIAVSVEIQIEICLYHGIISSPAIALVIDMACLVSLNRYITVMKPFTYHEIVTGRRAKCALGVAIAHAFLNSMIYTPFHGSLYRTFQDHLCQLELQQLTGNFYLLVLMLQFLVGIVVTVFTNVHLLMISRRHSKRITENVTRDNVEAPRDSNNNRAILTVILLNVVVFVSWIPFTLQYTLVFAGVFLPPVWNTIVLSLTWSATCWHCFVYIATNRTYRKTAKLTVMRMCVNFRCPCRARIQPACLADV